MVETLLKGSKMDYVLDGGMSHVVDDTHQFPPGAIPLLIFKGGGAPPIPPLFLSPINQFEERSGILFKRRGEMSQSVCSE